MADNSANIYPYPLQFDPSQWSNKYSPYAGVALPFMGAMGQNASNAPTDALGNPIPSYGRAAAANAAQPAAPAVSLNSTPQSSGDLSAYQQGSPYVSSGGVLPSGENYGSATPTYIPSRYSPPPPQQATPAPAPAPSPAVNMNQAYLAALQNPGKVTTPGANVPQAQFPSQGSGVLQSFLQNWQQGGSKTQGAGNYNNAPFYAALQGGQSAT